MSQKVGTFPTAIPYKGLQLSRAIVSNCEQAHTA
jgi:hypothetical protein